MNIRYVQKNAKGYEYGYYEVVDPLDPTKTRKRKIGSALTYEEACELNDMALKGIDRTRSNSMDVQFDNTN